MTTEKNQNETRDLSRRQLFKAGAIGAAGLAAVGVGANTTSAQPKPPAALGGKLRTNSKTGIRTAIVTDTQLNIGPYLAEEFARRKYNLVIADVQKGLPDKLRKLGAADVVVVPGLEQEGPNNEGRPGAIQKVVDAAMDKFGGYDSVFIRTAIHVGKNILEETVENMQISYEQNCLAVMYALQAVLPPLIKGGGGQVVVQTSATGGKPQPEMMSYSIMRAAADMMVRCAAMTVASKNIAVNVVGTNFMNYPGFREASGAEDPKAFQKILKEIPMGRLGETAEAAHFTMALLDGYNMYTTGNFFPIAGGFNNVGMEPFGEQQGVLGQVCRCAALTAAPKGVCVDAVGTNFTSADMDPKIMEALLEEIPTRRLGETREAAHFTMALLDGYNMYTTGNFFPVAGGFNHTGMWPL